MGFSKAAELVEQIILALAYPLFRIVHRSQLFLRNHIHLQPSSVFDSHVIGKKPDHLNSVANCSKSIAILTCYGSVAGLRQPSRWRIRIV